MHPDYNPKDNKNDIAIVKLTRSISHDLKYVSQICLPIETLHVDTEGCYVMGWGSLRSDGNGGSKQLRELPIKIVSESHCKNYDDYVAETMICAGFLEGGRDTCLGDSGGPFVCPVRGRESTFVLEGIVSFGEGCAERGKPGVYTRVRAFSDWVRSSANDE